MDIDTIARDNYFKQGNMISYLLAENLALKMYLYDKNLLTPEEFSKYQKAAEETLQQRVNKHIEEWKKENPDIVKKFAEAEKMVSSLDQTLPTTSSVS